MTGPYDDIIKLPHHTSSKRPRMSQANRAAQFAPFAALTGHGAAIQETARLTSEQLTLDENTLAELDRTLQALSASIDKKPEITVTHFVPDKKKAGGRYATTQGALCKIDEYERLLIFENGKRVAISDIVEILPSYQP